MKFLAKPAQTVKNNLKKLKLFDWILIGFSLVVIIVFAVIFFRQSQFITATVKVGEDSVFYSSYNTSWLDMSGSKVWFANLFSKGQTEKDGLGRVKAQVLDVYTYDKTNTRKTVYLTLKLNVVYNRASNTYTYKGVPVLIGSQIKLNLDKVYVEGTVNKVDAQGFSGNPSRKKIVVEARLKEENSTFSESSGVSTYLAEAVNSGDEVKDNHGKVLIKVLDKKISPAQKGVITSDGRVLLETDPIRKDVLFTLEVEASKIGGRYFFLDDIPILVDSAIPINTTTASIFPAVTKIITAE